MSRDDTRPTFLADPESPERIEVVSIDDGETVLFWELPVRDASRLLRALRTDLAQLSAAEFLARWDDEDH